MDKVVVMKEEASAAGRLPWNKPEVQRLTISFATQFKQAPDLAALKSIEDLVAQ
jgi:hypothetical protein